MKISTLLTMVTLSASCFAAPIHTAYDSTLGRTAQSSPSSSAATIAPNLPHASRADEAPVAPAAPDVAAVDNQRPQRWQFIALPKSRHLERGFAAQNEHLQT
ncbi:MAG TPA: hypothetical protein VEI25_05905 [Paraburkholderia sp.]|nr:hypothetical protein [Paraburkholderia sp.]